MSISPSFVAELLSRSARGYAAYAAERLREAHPESVDRFAGQGGASGWRAHLESRLQELATAVDLSDPGLFGAHMAWTRTAFEARGAPVSDLRVSLACLRDVLRAELPPGAFEELDPAFRAGFEAIDRVLDASPSAILAGTEAGRVAADFLLAVLGGDRHGATRAVLDAVPDRVSLKDAYLRVLLPAEVELGRLWHRNELTVGEEHFATATVGLVLGLLHGRMERAPANGRTVLSTACEGNQHTLASHVLADFFETDGWRTIHFNGPLPVADLIGAIRVYDVDVLALSATLSHQLRLVREMIEAIRASAVPGVRGVKVIVGGRAFDESDGAWRKVGADGYADSLDGAVPLARGLVGLGPG